MSAADRETITSTNLALETLIAETRRALTGERAFGLQQVQDLSAQLQRMASIVSRAGELRKSEPAIGAALDTYAELLRQLQTTLEQIHVMLLSRQAQMQQRQLQLHCIHKWASALRQTQ
jgi:hypothetical protein